MRKFGIILAVGLLAGCFGGRLKVGPTKGGEVVEAEGWSPYDAEDLLGTKKRSLVEAQKKAVEKVVGVYISAKTRVSQAITLNQNILANVSGYIKKYEIRSEKRDGGFYKTKIRALVRYEKVGEDLNALGLIQPDAPPGNPSVRVERVKGKGAKPATLAVRSAFRRRGFRVVDSPGAQADIQVGVGAEAHRLQVDNVGLGGFYSYRARVSLSAKKSSTGEVLGSQVKEASALDPTPAIAKEKSLGEAGSIAGDALAEAIYASLSRRSNVSVRVRGVGNLTEVQGLIDDLRTQPDIAMVTLGAYSAAETELIVTPQGFAGEELARILKQMKKYRFSIDSVSPYRVEVRVGSQ